MLREIGDVGIEGISDVMGFQAHGWSRCFPALCAMYVGNYAECIAYTEAALEASRSHDDRFDLAMTVSIVGGCLTGWGQQRRALVSVREARRLAESTGVRIAVATASMFPGLAPSIAYSALPVEELASSLERLEQTAYGFQAPALGMLRAMLAFKHGDLSAALDALQTAESVVRSRGYFAWQAPVLLGQAEVLIAMHGAEAGDDVEALLSAAVESMETYGTRVFRPRIHVVRSTLAAAAGDRPTARRERDLAIGLYREMGAPLPDDLDDSASH